MPSQLNLQIQSDLKSTKIKLISISKCYRLHRAAHAFIFICFSSKFSKYYFHLHLKIKCFQTLLITREPVYSFLEPSKSASSHFVSISFLNKNKRRQNSGHFFSLWIKFTENDAPFKFISVFQMKCLEIQCLGKWELDPEVPITASFSTLWFLFSVLFHCSVMGLITV